MTKLLANEVRYLPFQGVGDLGNTNAYNTNTTSTIVFTLLMSRIIGLLTAIAALWFIFVLITGAYGWMAAGSDKQALDNAKKKITNGVIGLFVVVISYTLIGVIGFIFGIDIIRLEALIQSINP